jgi:hypothetical protein
VVEGCLPALGVALDLRHVRDLELGAQIVQHLVRHIQRISKKPAHETSRGQLTS